MFRVASLDDAPTRVAVTEQMLVAGGFVDEVLVVEREVGADADVLDADEVDDVLEMADHRLQRGGVGAEKNPDVGGVLNGPGTAASSLQAGGDSSKRDSLASWTCRTGCVSARW